MHAHFVPRDPLDQPALVSDGGDRCGESPCWDAAGGRLLWVDNAVGDVFAHAADTSTTTRLASGIPANAVAVNADGRLVIAGAEGMFLRDAAGGMERVIATHAGEPLVFNDITVGPGGGVYGGTFHWNAAGMEQPGRLLLVRGAGEATVLDEGILLANGLGFSPDSSRLYFTDTIARKIYRYAVDPDTGLVADRRVFVDVPASEGLPDGLAVDAEGCVWSAQWYAGAVLRYDPDGRCIDRIALPVQQVSSLAFGGADLGDVYVTTAAEYWPSEHQPPGFDPAGRMGGGLYRMRVGVRGQVARRATLAAGGR